MAPMADSVLASSITVTELLGLVRYVGANYACDLCVNMGDTVSTLVVAVTLRRTIDALRSVLLPGCWHAARRTTPHRRGHAAVALLVDGVASASLRVAVAAMVGRSLARCPRRCWRRATTTHVVPPLAAARQTPRLHSCAARRRTSHLRLPSVLPLLVPVPQMPRGRVWRMTTAGVVAAAVGGGHFSLPWARTMLRWRRAPGYVLAPPLPVLPQPHTAGHRGGIVAVQYRYVDVIGAAYLILAVAAVSFVGLPQWLSTHLSCSRARCGGHRRRRAHDGGAPAGAWPTSSPPLRCMSTCSPTSTKLPLSQLPQWGELVAAS